MKAEFLRSFLQDVKKLREKKVREAIANAIQDVEQATSIDGIRSIKRLSGHQEYYRIRIGDFRIGIVVRRNVIHFVRCLHRREVYRYFP